MKKIKITTPMVKKAILWALLAALIALLLFVIIDSYGADHKLSNCSSPKQVDAIGEYKTYLEKHEGSTAPQMDSPITIPGIAGTVDSGTAYIINKSEDPNLYPSDVLFTADDAKVTYTVDIPQEGFYNIYLEYIPSLIDSGGANIERKIYVNNSIPFDGLNNIVFTRIWGDLGEKLVDLNKNEIKPMQTEKPQLHKSYVRDQVGYVTEPYLIHFNTGINKITIESLRETMCIVSVNVGSKESYLTYEEYSELHSSSVKVGKDAYIPQIEGEDSSVRSSSTLYAVSDRTSEYNSPSDPVRVILNAIGGSKWNTSGDWISWDFTAPQTGLYQISMRSKQNVSRGLFSTRKLYIDGEVPFDEVQNCKFTYGSDWSIVTLGNEDEPYYFYFTEGKHTITLECTLGDYGTQINRIQSVIDELNTLYRAIIKKTGINPDPYQDYDLVNQIPQLKEKFKWAADEIDDVSKSITKISGEKSSESSSLETMSVQLRDFVKHPSSIQKRLTNFSNNISSLGTWILTVSEQSLIVDYLMIHSDKFKLPKANPNFFVGSWYDISSFVQSFFFDYSSIGATDTKKDKENIEVWLLTGEMAGREQGNAIRTLIDSDTSLDINVTLKVVSPDVLLTATLANRGPDVAINVWSGTPVNYALRGATYDLTNFEDFEVSNVVDAYGNESYSVKVDGESTSRWQPSAMTPYEFNNGFYAIPNTQSFLVIFYRSDMFKENNWSVPKTWTDVINLIPELQIQNLQFYLPLNTTGASSVVNQIFASKLYQSGGRFYRTETNSKNEKYITSNFDSEEAMAAFEFWCQFYTDYSFPLAASFINRFRTGQTPIGIGAYELYNTLAVSAPEIKGKWNFDLLPGTYVYNEDGTHKLNADNSWVIDHSGAASGSAVIMMNTPEIRNKNDSTHRDAAWQFMKWWTSKDIQSKYASEIEAILGSAARHNTANVEAFKSLSWTVQERDTLLEQWEVTVGVPEVAGGYYTGRNLENAFRYVVNNNENPRETLKDYILTINSEITRKRQEFDLPVADPEN